MADNVRLASIGVGFWGKILAGAVAETGNSEIVSCYARREEGRAAFAEEFGCRSAASLDEVFGDEEVEGVLVSTSHSSHLEMIERAAAAGKAIFIEKPLTNTVAEGRKAIEAAERAGVPLMVGHQRRRTAANRRIKQMVEAGQIGDIEVMEAHQSIPNGFVMPEEAWRWSGDESPLGGMTSLGVHKLDSMSYLAGPVKSVFTFTRPGRTKPIDEATVLALEFESGAVATLATSFFVPVISELRVFGTEASAFNEADGARLVVQRRGEATREEVELDPVNPVVAQMAEFVEVVRGSAEPETDGAVGLEVVAMLAAAVESSQTGRAVDVAEHRA